MELKRLWISGDRRTVSFSLSIRKWLFSTSLQCLRSSFAFFLVAVSRIKLPWPARLAPDVKKLDEAGKSAPKPRQQPEDSSNNPKHVKSEYQYEKISGPRCIRLLRLLRNPAAAPLKYSTGLNGTKYGFSLGEYSLDYLPPYEALSYRWEGEMKMVLLGSQAIRVNATCKVALDHFSETRPAGSYAWIDAIYINQNYVKERNAQVTLMVDIYARARRTLVWLGKALPNQDFPANLYFGLKSKAFMINNIETDVVRVMENPLHPRDTPESGSSRKSLLPKKLLQNMQILFYLEM